jgi:hypothetical protein
MAMKLPALTSTLLLTLMLASCSLAPAAGPTAGPPTPPSPPVSPPTSPDAVPDITTDPTLYPQATQPPPPSASLNGIEGWQGSYCWLGACADMAQLPFRDELPVVDADASGELQLSLLNGATFVTWTVTYGEGEDDMSVLDRGGEPFDPDAMPEQSPVAINSTAVAAPPEGDWIVQATVHFPGGDLSYAWHVTVA